MTRFRSGLAYIILSVFPLHKRFLKCLVMYANIVCIFSVRFYTLLQYKLKQKRKKTIQKQKSIELWNIINTIIE